MVFVDRHYWTMHTGVEGGGKEVQGEGAALLKWNSTCV